jgi:hypothetical protein
LTDEPKAGLAKSDATLLHKSQPSLGVALLFHQKSGLRLLFFAD